MTRHVGFWLDNYIYTDGPLTGHVDYYSWQTSTPYTERGAPRRPAAPLLRSLL